MPGLAQRNEQLCNGSSQAYSASSANGFWSKHRDDVSYNQLQKFWTELSPQARQELLRIDKQTLFEQARKNMYCSRCNGLLLEGFLQIVMYGKSLQQEGASGHLPIARASRDQNDVESSIVNGCQDEIQDPSVHPWGGLITTREGSLTLMDCYLYAKSLKGLQNVFDSARARERERELLYPDACGGGGRGWMSQGLVGYGRVHGTRETCALHTARLSCDTLVDFWSALGEETRQSLLRMKEEDFIERLMYRFDSKRFCRDCRRNVIREFKELKELKRMRREPRCTSWFCVADSAFQYEVSDDMVYADWHHTFTDAVGTYHHFEWAVGTGEGKDDILDFENVGMNGSVNVDGLDLSNLSACFITLRAWKLDGRCTELSVKAHALKDGQCVHGRLMVGDGFVTITRGESIRRFFEHAEEAEEEEDDDSMDKDGNDLDGECSRPQKHAKSPELAREFLLDAATVIFKEQVEKAFREGTARQNAHSIFVCLALKLLEERVHVACKEIITLEKQMKLLEEEEKEKREEEERKERRRTKEREKKLRRKERLKGKEKDKDKDKNPCGQYQCPKLSDVPEEESSVVVVDSIGEAGNSVPCRPGSPNAQDDKFSNGFIKPRSHNSSHDCHDGELNMKDSNDSCTVELTKYSRRKSKTDVPIDAFTKWSERFKREQLQKEPQRCVGDNFESLKTVNLTNRQRVNGTKTNSRCGTKFCEKFHCSSNGRINDRYDFHSCSCNQNTEYRAKVEPHVSTVRIIRDTKPGTKSDSLMDISKQFYHGIKYNQTDHVRDSCGRPKSKFIAGNLSAKDLQPKKVWEPLESQKKCARGNSNSDFTLKSSALKVNGAELRSSLIKSSDDLCSDKVSVYSVKVDDDDNDSKDSTNSIDESSSGSQNGLHQVEKDPFTTKEGLEKNDVHLNHSMNFVNSASDASSDPVVSLSSSSDNCSSCLSEEGDSNTASSNLGNHESSSSSDSEDSSLRSEGKEASKPIPNGVSGCHEDRIEKNQSASRGEPLGGRSTAAPSQNGPGSNVLGTPPLNVAHAFDNGFSTVSLGSRHQTMLPPLHNQNFPFPVFQTPPTLGFYHQNPVSWPATPSNGLLPFSHPNQYVYAGPLGYGMNEDSRFCMPYGPLQHLPTPLYAPGPLPFYQSIAKGNVTNPDEKTQIPKPHPLQEAPNVATEESTDQIGLQSTHAASSGDGVQSEDPGKKHACDTSFSLFHFGGPVARSTGCQPNPMPPKKGIIGDFSSMCPTDFVNDKPGCNKKETTMEEYNLFAASNGMRFSFF